MNFITLTFFFEIIECHLKITLIKENIFKSSNYNREKYRRITNKS